MNDSDRRTNNVNRQSAVGMGLCIAGMGLLAWPIVSCFVGAGPGLMLLAVGVLIGLGLIVTGFAMMVAGAAPFDDDEGGIRNGENQFPNRFK